MTNSLLVPGKCDKVKLSLRSASRLASTSRLDRVAVNYISMVGEKNSAIKVVAIPGAAHGVSGRAMDQEQEPSTPGTNATRLIMAFPPTVIVRDGRENPKKCSIVPLRGRPDLIFLSYPANLQRPLPEEFESRKPDFDFRISDLDGYVRLAPDGPELSPADAGSGLLLLDGSWRRAEAMIRAYQHIPPRSLTGYRTAYPRVSKRGTDPSNGLATVEALFLAYHILSRPTTGLLDHYRWAEEFLRLNNLLRPESLPLENS